MELLLFHDVSDTCLDVYKYIESQAAHKCTSKCDERREHCHKQLTV